MTYANLTVSFFVGDVEMDKDIRVCIDTNPEGTTDLKDVDSYVLMSLAADVLLEDYPSVAVTNVTNVRLEGPVALDAQTQADAALS